MRISRADLVAPVLAIVVGGLIGVSLSDSFLLLSRSDVPSPDPVVVPSATAEAVRPEEQRARATMVYREQWAPLHMPDASGGPRVYVRVPIRKDGTGRIDLSLRTDPEDIEQRLFYVDGVRFGSSDLSLDQRDIESIESLKGDAAVALYGEEAFAGVIRVTLKEGQHRR